MTRKAILKLCLLVIPLSTFIFPLSSLCRLPFPLFP